MNCRYFACADCKLYIDAGYRWAYWQLEHPDIVRLGEQFSTSAVLAATEYWQPPPDGQPDWLTEKVFPLVRRFFVEHDGHRLLYLQEDDFYIEDTAYDGYTELVEKHSSPDGLLTLIVESKDIDDVYIGFDGYSWHTHASILASISGMREHEAVRQFVDDVLGSRAIIAIVRVGGAIRHVWIANEAVPDKYNPDDETIEFRYWNGRCVGSQ